MDSDFIEGETWENPKGETCPNCKKNKLYTVEVRNCLSKKDNKTYICSKCGDEETFLKRS